METFFSERNEGHLMNHLMKIPERVLELNVERKGRTSINQECDCIHYVRYLHRLLLL